MEKRERTCVRVCQRERGTYSAEIRWYSPFMQNEFIRGVRDSHCRESRFLCDNRQEQQTEGEKKSLISCSSEAAPVSGDQMKGWAEENGETGRGQTEQVRELNVRICLSEKNSDLWIAVKNIYIKNSEEKDRKTVERYVKLSWMVES